MRSTTIQSYKSFAKEFNPFLHKNYPRTKQAVQEYLEWLMDIKRNIDNTINQKISMLKRYGNFLVKEGYVPERDLQYFRQVKHRKYFRIPLFYDYSIIKRIHLVLENSSLLSPTEKLILIFVVKHATTYSELLGIRITDIDWHERMINIQKGSHTRYIVLERRELVYLVQYLQSKKGSNSFKSCLFLFQDNGSPLKKYEIEKSLVKLSAILNQKILVRGLRNTFIMQAIDLDMNVAYIQQYLGMKSLNSLSKFRYVNKTYFETVQHHVNALRSNMESDNDKRADTLFETIIKIFHAKESTIGSSPFSTNRNQTNES